MRRSNGMLEPPPQFDAGAECIRCREAPAIEGGLCGSCIWAIRAELEAGFFAMKAYLTNYARFGDYLAQRDHGDESRAA